MKKGLCMHGTAESLLLGHQNLLMSSLQQITYLKPLSPIPFNCLYLNSSGGIQWFTIVWKYVQIHSIQTCAYRWHARRYAKFRLLGPLLVLTTSLRCVCLPCCSHLSFGVHFTISSPISLRSRCLRRCQYGVFLPARQVVSSKLAVLLTFLMSGLFHDYIWAVLFYRPSYTLDAETGECNNDGSDDNVNVCLVPIFGKLAAFFFYTGIIMLLERPLSKRQPFVWISNNLPTFVISTMLIILHVPFAHWWVWSWQLGWRWFSLLVYSLGWDSVTNFSNVDAWVCVVLICQF